MIHVFLITFIIAYILYKLFKIKQSIKWADDLPGRKDWFFYNLALKVQNATPTGKKHKILI